MPEGGRFQNLVGNFKICLEIFVQQCFLNVFLNKVLCCCEVSFELFKFVDD
jgi:hypothetical protein